MNTTFPVTTFPVLLASLVTATILTFSIPAQAGDKEHHKDGQKRAMMEKLGLTDAQMAQIKELREQMKSGSLDKKDFRTQLESILTPDQIAKLKEAHMRRREKGSENEKPEGKKHDHQERSPSVIPSKNG